MVVLDANKSREANNSRGTNDGVNTRPERMPTTAGLQQQQKCEQKHGCYKKNYASHSREVNNRKETPTLETPGTAGMSTATKKASNRMNAKKEGTPATAGMPTSEEMQTMVEIPGADGCQQQKDPGNSRMPTTA